MFKHARSVNVSVAHRYWNLSWSDEQNHAVYGAQASREGLGNNLVVQLRVGTQATDFFDFAPHLRAIKQRVDHKCLFLDEPRFHNAPSTLETIAVYLRDFVFARDPGPGFKWLALQISEDNQTWIEVGVEPWRASIRVLNRNLNLRLERSIDRESGLAFDRSEVERAIRAVAPQFTKPTTLLHGAWAEELFCALKSKLPDLRELNIDLGRQGFRLGV